MGSHVAVPQLPAQIAGVDGSYHPGNDRLVGIVALDGMAGPDDPGAILVTVGCQRQHSAGHAFARRGHVADVHWSVGELAAVELKSSQPIRLCHDVDACATPTRAPEYRRAVDVIFARWRVLVALLEPRGLEPLDDLRVNKRIPAGWTEVAEVARIEDV